MVDESAAPRAGDSTAGNDESRVDLSNITLVDCAAIVWKRKLFVLACAVIFGLGTAVVHFVQPREYEAGVLLQPPRGKGGLSAKLASLGGELPISIPGMESPAERYVDILKSRRATDAAIEQFDLMRRYGASTRSDTRAALAERVTVTLTKGELIAITVVDEEPQEAARIANGFAALLDKIEREINVGQAGRQRRFLDERLAQVEKDLKAAQEAGKAFQQKHKIVRVDEGLRATATVIAELEAERIAKEIRLQVLETIYSKSNPQVEVLRAEVKKLNEKIGELARKGIRAGGAGGDEPQWLFPAIEKVPALAMEQLDLDRRLRLQGELYKLLVTQREMARIEEAKEVSGVMVISPAMPPDSPTGRGLLTKLLIGMASGLFLSGVMVCFISLSARRFMRALR